MNADNAKALIVGKNGQVGRELVLLAEARGLQFLAVGSAELDIKDQTAVSRLVSEYEPEVVINASAYTAVDKAETEKDLAYAVNRDGAAHLALAASAVGARLLHISTDYVFNGDKDDPYVESDAAEPLGCYGLSKYLGEEAIRQSGCNYLILRVSWVFGQHGNNFVKTMLRLAGERDELGVVADQIGAPTAARDIAQVLIGSAMGEGPKQGLFHMQSEPRVSWFEFANVIFEQAVANGLLKDAPNVNAISSEQFPTPARRPKNSKLDTCEADGVPVFHWKTGLSSMLEALKSGV